MSTDASFSPDPPGKKKKKSSPTQFFLKGLAIMLPPVLTLVIIFWVIGLIDGYILEPISKGVRHGIAWMTDESRPLDQVVRPESNWPALEYVDRKYRITPQDKEELQRRIAATGGDQKQQADEFRGFLENRAWVPMVERAVKYSDYSVVAQRMRPHELPRTAHELHMELVTTRYFGSSFLLSAVAVAVAIVLLWFIGRLVTVRLGAWSVHKFERSFMTRVPLVSKVYSSVKQVTDFFFTERTVEYNRVVAVEYPRRGVWSIGFVTSDSFLEITAAAGEPLVAVLMPTSPMPMTGFTISVPRSQVIDLNITVDEAFQFCLSCGVLVPSQQRVTPELLQQELTRRLTGTPPRVGSDGRETATAQPSAGAAESGSDDSREK